MNVNEQNTYHSEKSVPLTRYSMSGKGSDETLTNNQSTDVKIRFDSKKGVLETVKAFTGFSKVIGMALFMIFSQLAGAQANDDCIDAEPITCGDIISGSTLGATVDNAPNCFGVADVGNGVWYTLVGDGSSVTLSTDNPGTDLSFNTQLRVYWNTCTNLYCVASNDDINAGTKSEVTFTSICGATYYVLVDGSGSATLNFDLSMSCELIMDCEDKVIQLSSGECEANVNFDAEVEGGCGVATIECVYISGGFLGNGDPVNSGDAFPIGVHEIMCTATKNGVPGSCEFNITVIENEGDDDCVPGDEIFPQLGDDCIYTAHAGDLLKGDHYGCFDHFNVVIKDAFGIIIPGSPDIDDEYIGVQLKMEVTDPETGQTCWGWVTVEEKTPPELCCADFTISCTADLDPSAITGITQTFDPEEVLSVDNIPAHNGISPGEVELTFDVCHYLEVLDVNVSLDITHPNIEELSAVIENPDGAIVALFGTSALPCAFANAAVTFDDEAVATNADFDAKCNGIAPGKTGTYNTDPTIPLPLTLFDFETSVGTPKIAAGIWKIRISNHSSIAGTVTAASIEIEADYAQPKAKDNCDDELITAVLMNQYFSDKNCDYDDDENEDCYQYLYRVWKATDSHGNVTDPPCIQTICLTRPEEEEIKCPSNFVKLVCDDDDDPLIALQSLWLQNLIKDCDALTCGAEVSKCTYDGELVLVVSVNPLCLNPINTIYDCEGNVIPYDAALPPPSCGAPIWTCGDPLPMVTNTSVLHCEDLDDSNSYVDINGYRHPLPILTGEPNYNGFPINGVCGFGLIPNDDDGLLYEDIVVPDPDCEGNVTFKRTWMFTDNCDPGEMTMCEQIISVVDDKKPTVTCPPDMTANVGTGCIATVDELPEPTIDDVCSNSNTHFTATTTAGVLTPLPNGKYKLSNLPVNVTATITYKGFDGCDNFDFCTFKVKAEDIEPPTAICKKPVPGLNPVSLTTKVYANSFNNNSHDNCGIQKIEVRRLMDCDDNALDGPFGDYVEFECCDLGKSIPVQMRVTDINGLKGFCTVLVEAQDEAGPFFSYCPPNQDLTCDKDKDDLSNTGGAAIAANVCEEVTATYTDDVDIICGVGTIERTWKATIGGIEITCLQTLNVTNPTPFDPDGDYVVPPETTVTADCDDVDTNIDGPNWDTYVGCDANMVSASRWKPDEILGTSGTTPAGDDYCFKVIRYWGIYSWCTSPPSFIKKYDAQTIYVVDNVAPVLDCDIISASEVELGVDLEFEVSAEDCTDDYAVEIPGVTITYSIYDTNNPGVPLDDFEDIPTPGVIVTIPTGDSPNELPTGEYEVVFTATDACGNFETCEYVVTVGTFTCDNVKAGPFPIDVGASTADYLLYANYTNHPNYPNPPNSDEELYDVIPPSGLKLSLDGVTANAVDFLPFSCDDIVNNEPTPKTIYIHLLDGTTCEREVNIIDNTTPSVAWKPFAVSLPSPGPNGTLIIADYDYLFLDPASLDDNCTLPSALTIEYSTDMVTCPGGPFPPTITVTVRDLFAHGNPALDGNPNSRTFDVTYSCSAPPTFNVSGGIANEEGAEVEHVDVEVEGVNMLDVATTGDDGTFGFNLPSIENYVVTPERDDNVLNGVSTYDLVLISKHILQFELLQTPYKIIAADVNHSGTVSTIDLVTLRKVILFIDDEFTNNTSWRFVDADFVFPDPTDPFATSFPELFTINGLSEDEIANFVGVKIGDVNCSAAANDLMNADDRNTDGELVFTLADQDLTAGETYQFDFEAKDFDQVEGFQFTLNYNTEAIVFNEVNAGDLDNLSEGNFGLHKLNDGIITASWNANSEAQSLENGKVLFSFSFTAMEDGQLSDLISLNSRFTKAEAYDNRGVLDLALAFVDENGAIATEQFELYQNQPNPFKDETVVGFYLPESGKATFTVYDISGRVIKSIEDDYSKGYNEISINRSELQSSGVLYYQLENAEHIASKKMVLID